MKNLNIRKLCLNLDLITRRGFCKVFERPTHGQRPVSISPSIIAEPINLEFDIAMLYNNYRYGCGLAALAGIRN
jgi:hypothetical protein